MARPKKEPDEQRSESVRSTLTVSEKLHVQAQAKAAGLSEAEFARRRLLGYEVPPTRSLADAALITEVNRLSWEINRIGVNVDQLLLATYRGSDFVAYWGDIGTTVHKLAGEAETVLKRLAALDGA